MKIVYFLLFVLLNLIIIYLDKFLLVGSVIIFYLFSVFLFFIKTKTSKYDNYEFKKNKIVIYVSLFSIGFCIFYYLFSHFIFAYNIIKIENLSIYEFVKLAFIFPVLEELIFRKYFLSFLAESYSNFKSILIVSIGFVLCHLFSDSGILNVFLISLFYSWIFLKTRNIYLCFFAHIFNNSFIILILPYLITLIDKQIIVKWVMFLLSIILIVYSLLKIHKLKINNPSSAKSS